MKWNYIAKKGARTTDPLLTYLNLSSIALSISYKLKKKPKPTKPLLSLKE
jgi:hypothetical protein